MKNLFTLLFLSIAFFAQLPHDTQPTTPWSTHPNGLTSQTKIGVDTCNTKKAGTYHTVCRQIKADNWRGKSVTKKAHIILIEASENNFWRLYWYSPVNAPADAGINLATGEFSWTPASSLKAVTETFPVRVGPEWGG